METKIPARQPLCQAGNIHNIKTTNGRCLKNFVLHDLLRSQFPAAEYQDEEAQFSVTFAFLYLFVGGIAAKLLGCLFLQNGNFYGTGIAACILHLHQITVGYIRLALQVRHHVEVRIPFGRFMFGQDGVAFCKTQIGQQKTFHMRFAFNEFTHGALAFQLSGKISEYGFPLAVQCYTFDPIGQGGQLESSPAVCPPESDGAVCRSPYGYCCQPLFQVASAAVHSC